jgi:CheY-like chemotaxis protein
MNKRMLIVDDEPALSATISRIATALGFDTETVNDPNDAAGACQRGRPDILLLDMIMPHGDGITVLKEILDTCHVPHVVLMSGLSEGYLRLAENLARIHGNCKISTLTKPFRRADLAKIVSDST